MLLAGRRHSIAGAQGLQSYEGAGSPEYSTTSNAEKILSPRNVEPIGIYKGHQRQVPSVVTTQKKRSKTLSFGDLSKQFDDHLSQAAAAGKFDSQPGEVLFEGDRQAVAEMAKVSIAAQSSTSFRMNQAAAAIGGSPNLPHQLPQSVEENWSAKQHAFGIIKEPESLVPSSPDDPCTKGERLQQYLGIIHSLCKQGLQFSATAAFLNEQCGGLVQMNFLVLSIY
jgi:hypothetical protein